MKMFVILSTKNNRFANGKYAVGISSPLCRFMISLIGFVIGANTNGPAANMIKYNVKLPVYQNSRNKLGRIIPMIKPVVNNNVPPIIIKTWIFFLTLKPCLNSLIVSTFAMTRVMTNPGPMPIIAEIIWINTNIL